MRQSRFTEEQIIGVLREQERIEDGGRVPSSTGSAADVLQVEVEVRRAGRVRCQAVEASTDENAEAKKLLAEAMLDNAILKDVEHESGDARRQAAGGGSPSCGMR